MVASRAVCPVRCVCHVVDTWCARAVLSLSCLSSLSPPTRPVHDQSVDDETRQPSTCRAQSLHSKYVIRYVTSSYEVGGGIPGEYCKVGRVSQASHDVLPPVQGWLLLVCFASSSFPIPESGWAVGCCHQVSRSAGPSAGAVADGKAFTRMSSYFGYFGLFECCNVLLLFCIDSLGSSIDVDFILCT